MSLDGRFGRLAGSLPKYFTTLFIEAVKYKIADAIVIDRFDVTIDADLNAVISRSADSGRYKQSILPDHWARVSEARYLFAPGDILISGDVPFQWRVLTIGYTS
jgi:hypothetical protein